jgi:hypothetical protein
MDISLEGKMISDNQHKGKKIHSRNIEISTYEYDEENIIVEGELKEDLLIPIYVSGKKRRPHTVHHMVIKMLIDCSSLTIKEIIVEMPGIPYDWCTETSDSLDSIKGLKIAPGFTSKVRKIVGESKKCSHLTTLLLAIAPAVMQGYWIYNARKPSGGKVPSGMMENYLIDTCWVWRKDGPLVGRLKPT